MQILQYGKWLNCKPAGAKNVFLCERLQYSTGLQCFEEEQRIACSLAAPAVVPHMELGFDDKGEDVEKALLAYFRPDLV